MKILTRKEKRERKEDEWTGRGGSERRGKREKRKTESYYK